MTYDHLQYQEGELLLSILCTVNPSTYHSPIFCISSSLVSVRKPIFFHIHNIKELSRDNLDKKLLSITNTLQEKM